MEARVRSIGWEEEKVNDIMHVAGKGTQAFGGAVALIPSKKVGRSKRKKDFAVRGRAAFLVQFESGAKRFAMRDTSKRLPISVLYSVKWWSEALNLQRVGEQLAQGLAAQNIEKDLFKELARAIKG
jgi:hypothetical protein